MSTTWPYAGRGLSSQSAIESVLGYRWTRWMLIVTWLMGHNWIFPQWMILHDDTHVYSHSSNRNAIYWTSQQNYIFGKFQISLWKFDISVMFHHGKWSYLKLFTEWCINQRLLPRLSCQVNFGPGKRVSKLQHRDGITCYRVHSRALKNLVHRNGR